MQSAWCGQEGGCTEFCVNGLMAGNRRISRTGYDLNTKKAVPKDLIDTLLADYNKPEDLIGENGLLKQLTLLLVERALDAELSDHLGHDKNAPVTNPGGNARNGKSKKTLKGEFGELPIDIPRDRQGSFVGHFCSKIDTMWF